jgi:glycerol-3-phosphate acyltransferase PlsX
MDASYTEALRRNSGTSIAVGMEAVRRGDAAAFISAGHTGAVFANALVTLGRFSAVERPAIMTLWPSSAGPVALVDAGANVDCKPEHLRDFARMGSLYMEEVLGIKEPPVGLLSIGTEPQKGNKLTRGAWQLLADSGVNFIGNVEGDTLFTGECRVFVCDGFVGNVVLKACEGFGQFVLDGLNRNLRSEATSQDATDWHKCVDGLRQIVDYAEYGGALLLGVNGLCVICHGRSDSRAIVNSIRLAERSLEHQAIEKMRCAVDRWAAGVERSDKEQASGA